MARIKVKEGGEHLLMGVGTDDASRAIYRMLTFTCTKLRLDVLPGLSVKVRLTDTMSSGDCSSRCSVEWPFCTASRSLRL